MQTQRIALGLLQASTQPRDIAPADVDKLAASIREIGLISPITVRPTIVVGNIAKDAFQIVAGHHRVAAVRALGWTEIDAIVVHTENRLQAELIEIDENLVRSELTPAQRIHYTSRRAEIRQALNPEPSRDYSLESYGDGGEDEQVERIVPPVAKHGHAQPKAFAAETAVLTGQSKQEINRQLAVGKAIGEDLQRVVGTSLDKGVELTALAKLPEPERKDLIERAAAGEKVTARTAAPVPTPVQPPVAGPQPTPQQVEGSEGDAKLFISEVWDFLERVRVGLNCSSIPEASVRVSHAMSASEDDSLHESYFRAASALDKFLQVVESTDPVAEAAA